MPSTVQDGRIHIEKISAPLFRVRATPAEYSAGLKLAIERAWLVLHESGTFVRFRQAGQRVLRKCTDELGAVVETNGSIR
jgi:hypothetical protein